MEMHSVELEVEESLLRRAERNPSLGSEVTEGIYCPGRQVDLVYGDPVCWKGSWPWDDGHQTNHPPCATHLATLRTFLPSGCSRGVVFLLLQEIFPVIIEWFGLQGT